MRFQNLPKNAAKNCEIATLVTFLTKDCHNFAMILPQIGFFLHQHCWHIGTFLHLWEQCRVTLVEQMNMGSRWSIYQISIALTAG